MKKVTQSEEEMVTGFEFRTGKHFCTVYSFTLPLMSSSSVFKDYDIVTSLVCMKKSTISNTCDAVLMKHFFLQDSTWNENI